MLAKNLSIPASAQLSDNYYLENFTYLVEFVEQYYRKLLQAVEQQFCEDFKNLSDNAQKYYVRLALRAPNLLRTSKLHYPEIDHPEASINELVKNQFLSYQTEPTIDECRQLFSRAELKSVGITGVSCTTETVESTHWTSADLFGQSPLERLLASDQIIEVHHKPLINTFRLLFFGNLHQDFSSFVLRDLGLRRYESYTIDTDTLLFQSREQLQAHADYYQCAELFDPACEHGADALIALHQQLPGTIQGDNTLTRRLNNLANKIARQLEREDALNNAAEIYQSNQCPPARERLTRIKAKLGDKETALTLCKEIIATPVDSDELDFATSFGHRLAKKSDCEFARPDLYTPPEIQLALKPQGLNVEFSVALDLAKQGKCYYLENSLLGGVFGLAFWDIIFSSVKGVFFHPFHSRPTDLYEPGFTQQREEQIEQRLSAIANGELHHFAFKHLFEKRGTRNPFVNWHLIRNHILALAIQRIPATDWQAIFRLLLTDIRNYRSGQPDLVWFPDDGGYQLLEVKAPGDRLQKNQLRWMRFFRQQNISHGVVHVEWIDE